MATMAQVRRTLKQGGRDKLYGLHCGRKAIDCTCWADTLVPKSERLQTPEKKAPAAREGGVGMGAPKCRNCGKAFDLAAGGQRVRFCRSPPEAD
jgi:hypothetical protein